MAKAATRGRCAYRTGQEQLPVQFSPAFSCSLWSGIRSKELWWAWEGAGRELLPSTRLHSARTSARLVPVDATKTPPVTGSVTPAIQPHQSRVQLLAPARLGNTDRSRQAHVFVLSNYLLSKLSPQAGECLRQVSRVKSTPVVDISLFLWPGLDLAILADVSVPLRQPLICRPKGPQRP